MTIDVEAALRDRGFEGRVVCIDHLGELEQEMAQRRECIDDELFEAYLSGLLFEPPASLPQARSIVVVAMPDPLTAIQFGWQGQTVVAQVPPTYLYERRKDGRARQILEQHLAPAGYGVADVLLPKKLLAARSGLSTYGRNNITYIPGMGSFYRLAAFYTEWPCAQDPWMEPQMLPGCESCQACQRACPTGAISGERFLLHAERCLTFHNEKDSAVPLPGWMDPAAHRWLVGCLHCQRVCPEDKPFHEWVEQGASFSEQETALLLEGRPVEALPADTQEKLQQAGLSGYYEVLARNLGLLLQQQVAAS